MTMRGHSPLHPSKPKQMARLLQLHAETHPRRVAERFGVTERYVRKVWSRFATDEMAPLSEALEALGKHP